MDLFLSVHLQKQYLLITLLINLLILFKWTLLERSLRSLLRSLVIKSLIDNIFVERLGLIRRIYNVRLRGLPFFGSPASERNPEGKTTVLHACSAAISSSSRQILLMLKSRNQIRSVLPSAMNIKEIQ